MKYPNAGSLKFMIAAAAVLEINELPQLGHSFGLGRVTKGKTMPIVAAHTPSQGRKPMGGLNSCCI